MAGAKCSEVGTYGSPSLSNTMGSSGHIVQEWSPPFQGRRGEKGVRDLAACPQIRKPRVMNALAPLASSLVFDLGSIKGRSSHFSQPGEPLPSREQRLTSYVKLGFQPGAINLEVSVGEGLGMGPG